VMAPPSRALNRRSAVAIRGFRPHAAEDELRLMYDLSMRAFADALFFKKLDWPGFQALYAPVVPLIDPELVLIAETPQGGTLGFLFALPDPSASTPTAIVKTYASLRRGVGGLMGEAFYRNARAKGFTSVIHALMQEDNLSLRQSTKRNGQVFRRYALLGRMLAP
jgi:hypothetical protein